MSFTTRLLLACGLLFTGASLASANDEAAPASPEAAAEKAEADEAKKEVVLGPEYFAVPEEATVGELQEFIAKMNRRPNVQFKTREDARAYLTSSNEAKAKAAVRIVEIAEDDKQLLSAAKLAVGSYTMMARLRVAGAGPAMSKFKESLLTHKSPAVVGYGKVLQLEGDLNRWQIMAMLSRRLKEGEELDPKRVFTQEDKAALFTKIKEMSSNGDLDYEVARLASNVANFVGDTADSAMAAAMLEDLLPKMHASEKKQVQAIANQAEGLLRRMKLPGNFIEVDGTLLSGDPIDWSSYRGKVVLVDFWATWCGPCIRELPNVKDNYAKYHEKGFDVVGVSLDGAKDGEKVESFLADREIPWVTLLSNDPQNDRWKHPLVVKYGIRGIPRAILVDQQGNVVHMNARGEALGEQLQLLLGDPIVQDEANAEAEENAQAST